MSSRALRKAQREKEEQERLKRLEEEAHQLSQDYDEEDDEPAVVSKRSAFAMLGDDDDAEEGEDEADDADEANEEIPATTPAHKPSSKKKKKKKKAKSAGAATQESKDTTETLDEIDAALKSLSTNGNSNAGTSHHATSDPALDQRCRLMAVESSNLHAANEMRLLFGRTTFQNEDEELPQAAAGGNRRQQRRLQQVGPAQAIRGQHSAGRQSGLASILLRRNIFIQGKEEWPVATSGGLSMTVEKKNSDGTVLFRYVHSTAYQELQSEFESAVATLDPNELVALLREHPYHISTLLQVSEIVKQERDNTFAGDLLERALFSFGRSVHSTFAARLAEGKARLDFRRLENREFWLASWRYVQNLTLRATWRTVYEWTKLLLSLSPEDDPYALWLVLDQYALRSRQDLDYLNISRNTEFARAHINMPNIEYSQALGEFRAGNQGKGKQALFKAIGRHPWVAARLFQELNIDAPPAVWGAEPRTEKEKLWTELYATRAKDIWKRTENSSLLQEIASALPPDTPTVPIDETAEIYQNEARHVILSDTPALIALIPRKFTEQFTSTSDPIPPDDAFMSPYLTRTQARQGHGGRDSEYLNEEESGIYYEALAASNLVQQDLDDLGIAHEDIEALVSRLRNANREQGADGAGQAGDDDVRGQAMEILSRFEDGGGRQQLESLRQRAQRLIVLNDRLIGVLRPGTEGVPAAGAGGGNERRARVEDAPEEEEQD